MMRFPFLVCVPPPLLPVLLLPRMLTVRMMMMMYIVIAIPGRALDTSCKLGSKQPVIVFNALFKGRWQEE
jgi:hypothetical protein